MPQLEELECYLRGLWLLFRGRAEGFGWLDFSERGFWRSWWAALFCVPPMLLSWAAFRTMYLSMLPEGARVGSGFFASLAVIEVSGWLLPALIIFVVSTVAGLGRYALPLVISVNWLSVPLQWLYSIQNMLQLLAPRNDELLAFTFLAFVICSAVAHFRIARSILGGESLAASAVVLAVFIGSYVAQYQLLNLLGLWPS